VKELTALGIEKDTLQGVHSPIGLHLGAETPEEIALSIMAEIVMLRNRGSIGSMRYTREEKGNHQENTAR
jgi:xanthine dehydrogenase accessory factor